MNYKDMTDFEINKAVAEALGFELTTFSIRNIGRQTVIKELMGNDWIPVKIPDYCNNPSDAWPVIVDNKINITAEHGFDEDSGTVFWYKVWESEGLVGGKWISATDENPLRAAMIVYLMMKGDQ